MKTPLLLLTMLMLLNSYKGNAHHHKRVKRAAVPFAGSYPVRLRVTPSGMINRFGRILPLGVEYCLNRNFSVLADLAIPFLSTIRNGQNRLYRKDILQHYRIEAQLRYYFGKRKDTRWMTGYEGFWVYQDFREQNGEYHDNENYKYTSAHVRKSVLGVAAFFGESTYLGGRMGLEIRAGMGIKWITINRQHITGLERPVKLTGFFPTNEDQVADYSTLIYFPASVSLTVGLGRRWQQRSNSNNRP